jgi:hypothetical protein
MTFLPEYSHANDTIPAHSPNPGAHVLGFMFSAKNTHLLQACAWSQNVSKYLLMQKKVVKKFKLPRQSRATNKYFPNRVCTSKWMAQILLILLEIDRCILNQIKRFLLKKLFLKLKTDVSCPISFLNTTVRTTKKQHSQFQHYCRCERATLFQLYLSEILRL